MILTCPECTTRYRFDESMIPAGGRAVRCKRCRMVFRAHGRGAQSSASGRAAPRAASPVVAAKAVPAGPNGNTAKPATHAKKADHHAPAPAAKAVPSSTAARAVTPPRTAPKSAAGPPQAVPARQAHAEPEADGPAPYDAHEATSPSQGPAASIPVKLVPPPPGPKEEEIRRLTRIILSDIVIYSPERADGAMRDGRFIELFRSEVEEGRKVIRSRFQGQPAAVETYERCLRELLDARRKELQESAGAV